MKKHTLMAVTLAFGSINGMAKGPEGFYCQGRSTRAYSDLGTVTDSTGNPVGHVGRTENGARVAVIDSTHKVLESSHQNSENEARGAFFPLTISEIEPREPILVRRMSGRLTFDRGYAVQIHAVEIEGEAPTSFSLSLLKLTDGRISRILGRQEQNFFEGAMYASLHNLDVDNAWLSVGSNVYKDGHFRQLANLIAEDAIEDGVMVNARVECTPKQPE